MTSYTVSALEGERLDRIAKRLYGTESGGTVEALLNANPGIAALGTILPVGTVIAVPAEVATQQAATYQLAWE